MIRVLVADDQALVRGTIRLLVDDEHADHPAASPGPRSTGSRAATRKPCPGSGPAWNSPPNRLTRSAIPAMP